MDTVREDELPPAPPQKDSLPAHAQSTPMENLAYKSHFDARKFVTLEDSEKLSYLVKGEHYNNVAIVCIHGAGFSGLSFSQFAGGMQDEGLIISFDLRGHGMST